MRNVAKGDISKLCEHVRQLTYELNAAGETTNDLLSNLIEALKEAPDANFQRWLSNQVDLWSMRKIDWKIDGSDLMEDAEVYYQEAVNTHRWGRKAQRQDVVYAFKAESDEEVNEHETTNSFEETIKALSEQLREYTEACAARSKDMEFDDVKVVKEMDDKYAWKFIPPKHITGVQIIINGLFINHLNVRGKHQGSRINKPR
jgi:hypothetical protein